MTKEKANSLDYRPRKIFCKDIEKINAFVAEMQDHVAAQCFARGIIYPKSHPGRGVKGLRPNFQYAVYFMLQGIDPATAADSYIGEQLGDAIPLPEPEQAAGVA